MSEPKQRSELVDRLLAQYGTPDGDGRASVHPCQGAKFHSPTPLVTVCYEPYPGKQIWLCPTCLANLQCFVFLYDQDPEVLTWDVMREFGNIIRLLGQDITRHRSKGKEH